MKYYGIAQNHSGVSTVIFNLSDDRLNAVNEAREHCKKNGLTFQYVLPDKSTVKGGSTLTKFKKQRVLNSSKKR